MADFQCFVCGNRPDLLVNGYPFCTSCSEQLKEKFLMKCATCGAWGFIPVTPKSIFYLAESQMDNNIALTNYCPNCSKQIDR